MQKYVYPKKPKPVSYASNDMKTVLSVVIENESKSQLFIRTTEELPEGVPVQLQFEIVPQRANLKFTKEDGTVEYCSCYADIKSIKARIKPSTLAFIAEEEKQLDHIINDTEDADQEKERARKIKQKTEINRFTGLEI